MSLERPTGFSVKKDFTAIRKRLKARPPRWRDGILATAIGPKIENGVPTNELSLQVIVKSKLPNKALARSARIPKSYGGLTTDVLDSHGELAPLSKMVIPAAPPPVGYGVHLLNSAGLFATAGFAAADSEGNRFLTTAAHFADVGEYITIGYGAETTVGVVTHSVTSLPGSEMYGDGAQYPDERFSIDTAIISLPPDVPIAGGLPGSSSFVIPADADEILGWLDRSEVLSFGQGTGGWRTGVVTGLFPQRPKGKVTGFCLVQHQPTSLDGDSGSLWLALRGADYVGVGTHWGLVYNYAFLNDIAAVMRCMNLTSYFGQAST